jgi:hypothetical protein
LCWQGQRPPITRHFQGRVKALLQSSMQSRNRLSGLLLATVDRARQQTAGECMVATVPLAASVHCQQCHHGEAHLCCCSLGSKAQLGKHVSKDVSRLAPATQALGQEWPQAAARSFIPVGERLSCKLPLDHIQPWPGLCNL